MEYPPLPGLEDGCRLKTAWSRGIGIRTDGTPYAPPAELVDLRYVSVGHIAVPSGKLVVADMHGVKGTSPHKRSVPAGTYGCEIVQARFASGDTRTAVAIVRVSGERPVSLVSAWREDDDESNAKPGECAAIGVDSATICICDSTVEQTTWATDPVQDDAIDSRLSATGAVIHAPSERPDLRFLLSTTGWGDGSYVILWGLDRGGRIACLIVDFELVEWDPRSGSGSWMSRVLRWFRS